MTDQERAREGEEEEAEFTILPMEGEPVEEELEELTEEQLAEAPEDAQIRATLRELAEAERARGMDRVAAIRSADAPLDLRVNRPQALNLEKLWAAQGVEVPPEIRAALGPSRPVLLHHLVTPFARDGGIPGGVWSLGYGFQPAASLDANTKSVTPSNETLTVGSIGQKLDLGVAFDGAVRVPKTALPGFSDQPLVSLEGASLHAATSTEFKLALRLSVTLRKVLGAGVGVGGAKWQLYRQDEPLDVPHVLMQTLLVPRDATEFRCTVSAWARKAGFLGTRLFSKFWQMPERRFRVRLGQR